MVLKKNTLKYRFFQVLAFLGDAGLELLVNEVAKGKKVYLGRKRYSSRHFYRVFKEFTTTGYIERINRNSKVYLKLTPIAKTTIANNIPLPTLQQRHWDRYFRGIAYDFPEKIAHRRDSLRMLIKTWGMGQFQRSIWITPHALENPIDDFIESNKLSPFVQRIMTKKLSLKEGKDISEKVWNLGDLYKDYLDFGIGWMRKVLDKKIEKKDLKKLRFEYFAILEKDPYLPSSLLPRDWPADYARESFLAAEQAISKL